MKVLLPPHLFLICCLGMVLLRMYYPYYLWISMPYNLTGVVLVVAGLAVSTWGSNTFRQHRTNIHTFQKPDQLVMEGLFKYSRNPMYVGFLIALVGLLVVLGEASPAMFVLLFLIVTDRWYIKHEENALNETFGAEYERYKASTRRWI
ncbi:isoprenylcysteine carboxylmethyltransferase family protein [Halalkalibacter sp. APA_J-10(15)]|uniref:methyltransferase family protein n=1 Tax=Halalkalibacter sp. APA_J-10(15) TaxID=2933805 RepID=UPI001FF67549|nr:isoprenylcysteine carboxylmethyltransferase family protein [Halalkalibacter sp. APA_J-10(15)]MCK0469858.1 isoprenylcysteine carboxylmethyltransferase family protein [Halalkalibacter sp. APA_J-10(15)]